MTDAAYRDTDRRRTPRYSMALQMHLEAPGDAQTRDLSCAGVFFETREAPAPGTPIRFSLVFEHLEPGAPRRLVCEGEVVRLERRAGHLGVAATIRAGWFDPTEGLVA